jgi:hypothetical protein
MTEGVVGALRWSFETPVAVDHLAFTWAGLSASTISTCWEEVGWNCRNRHRSLLCSEVNIAEHASNPFGVQRHKGGEIRELLQTVRVGVGSHELVFRRSEPAGERGLVHCVEGGGQVR